MRHPLVQLPQFASDFFRRHPGGRRRMLALTYRFTPGAFEHLFAQVLTKRVQVDIVSGESAVRASTRCRLWRANWRGTFHPKLLILMSNNRVAVGLGSANMTAEGISENLESWAYFEGKDDAPAISGVRRFLELLDASGVIDPAVRIAEFTACLPTGGNNSSVFWTLDGTLLSQVTARLNGPEARLDVVSPISADPSKLVASLRKRLSIREVRLYTNGQVPPAVEGVDRYWVLKEGPRSERRMARVHSKLFAFHKGQHVDLFWGSANLSCAAWLCTGKKSNVELFVHSRISRSHWQSLLESLPEHHSWCEVRPGPPDFRVEDRGEQGWLLLHGTFEREVLRLAASGSGMQSLRLRSKFATVAVKLQFDHGAASVPERIARKLGFGGNGIPDSLDWWTHATGWHTIPINALDLFDDVEIENDLAGELFEMYAGRCLPGSVPRAPASRPPDEPDQNQRFDEEKDLTHSVHQGELDQFVLRWRLAARAMNHASVGNDLLRACRINDAVARMTRDADARPEEWPQYRQRFVKELLENSWPA